MRNLFSAVAALLRALLLPGLVGISHILAQQPSDTVDNKLLLPLLTGWEYADGSPLRLPLIRFSAEPIEIHCRFAADACFPDTVYLYLEGVGWEAELELNGRYLGVHRDPFRPWALPVNRAWLREQDNRLILRLVSGEPLPMHPQPFIGLFRPVYLLAATHLDSMQNTMLPEAIAPDTVGLIAPYYRRKGYIFDEMEACRLLQPLIRAGIRDIHFLFGPGRDMRRLCARLGFREVRTLKPGMYVCAVNEFPYEPVSLPGELRFWLNREGYRTMAYGDYIRWGAFVHTPPRAGDLPLTLMILLPALALFFVKTINPGFFYAQQVSLFRPARFVGSIQDSAYTNPSLLLMLTLLRILCLSAALALSFYYINQEHLWQYVQFIRHPSLLREVFYGSETPGGFFVRGFLVIGGWLGFKYLLIAFIGQVFRIKNILTGTLSLDVVGSFPLVLVLPLPVACIQFMNGAWTSIMMVVIVLLGATYIIRRMYVSFIGLDRIFGFSTGVKFLYICALNILPYLVWL
ncbi:MAG: DUF4271 domain-containing protein [Bacteroidetes bacterium]|nr:MAG: DUF4271 domain-containing protein [Bacteroidota bacterium]